MVPRLALHTTSSDEESDLSQSTLALVGQLGDDKAAFASQSCMDLTYHSSGDEEEMDISDCVI
jgi:hypothetical protein